MRILLATIMAVLSTSCTHLAGVSVSDIGTGSKKVRADVSNTQILFFGYDADFVHDLSKELGKKCGGKPVQGITTAYETSWYFIVTVYTVTAEGTCG